MTDEISAKKLSSSDPHQVTFFDIFSDILSGILSGRSSEILCGGGPAGNTLIRSSRLRPGGEQLDPELAVQVRGGNTLILSLLRRSGGERFDPELAMEVRLGTLRWWSGGEHSDPELGVEARRGTL